MDFNSRAELKGSSLFVVRRTTSVTSGAGTNPNARKSWRGRRPGRTALAAAATAAAFLLLAVSAQAATITVSNTNDSGPGSLRQALADAHNEDVINFDPSLNGQRITLTSGELVVNKIVSIYNPDPNNLAIDANHASRVFHVTGGASAGISGLSIINGS